MTLSEFLYNNVFFTTRDYSQAANMTLEASSRKLNNMENTRGLAKVTRGIWAQIHHPFFSPYGAVPFILGNEQGYVSFLTALHRHGLISQIPSTIQVATTGRGRVVRSPIGTFELFHLQPRFHHQGIELFGGKTPYSIATPEKALIDTLYLSKRKGRRFARLPEIDTSLLRKGKLRKLVSEAPSAVQNLLAPALQRYY